MFDFIVAGAGIVGLTAAYALGQKGHKVLIIDKNQPYDKWREESKPYGRIHAYNQNSIEYFSELGIWSQLPENSIYDFLGMRIVGGDQALDLCEAKKNLGAFLSDAAMCPTIILALNNMPNIEFAWQQNIIDFKQAYDTVYLLTEDQEFRGNILLAADGARSFIRQKSKIKTNIFDYQQTCFVGFLDIVGNHRRIAWQDFTNSGTLGLLPYGDNTYSLALSIDNNLAININPDTIVEFLQKQRLPEGISINSIKHCQNFPLYALHAHKYFEKNIVLIGDAAHTIHPLAGLGLNLGIADVKFLTNTISDNPKAAILAYDKNQSIVNARIMHGLTLMQKLLRRKFLAELALAAASKSGPIKEALMQIANQRPIIK